MFQNTFLCLYCELCSLLVYVISWSIIEQVVGRVFPESPRWLLAAGRYEEAGRLLRNVAATNGRALAPDYLVGLKRRFRVELALHQDKQRESGGHTLLDLLSTSNMRKKVVLLIFISSLSSTAGVGLTYQAVFEKSVLSVQLSFAICAAAEVTAAVCAAVLVYRAGRRCTAFCFGALGGAACILQVFSAPYLGWRMSVVLLAAAKWSSHIFSVVLQLWMREHLPLVIREKGFYFIDTLSLIGPVFVPLVIYQIETYPSFPMLCYGGMLLTSVLLSLGLPDTRHALGLRTLHDGEMFGKYWRLKDYFSSGPKKTDHKNGILKCMDKKPQSPILGLLRKRDSFHLANAEGEIEVLECNFDIAPPEKNPESAVKVTVL